MGRTDEQFQIEIGVPKARFRSRSTNYVQNLIELGPTLERRWRGNSFIQTAYCVSILTFISRMEKEKGLGSVPYFHAIIDFHFVEHHSSCFCRSLFLPNSFESLHSIFSCSSITSRKHGSQYATELPAFQPLDSLTFHHSRRQNKGYRSIPGTVNKYILHS